MASVDGNAKEAMNTDYVMNPNYAPPCSTRPTKMPTPP
jgi:hypothetical protein